LISVQSPNSPPGSSGFFFIPRSRSSSATRPVHEPDRPSTSGGLIDSFPLVPVSLFTESEPGVFLPDTDFTMEKMNALRMMIDLIRTEG
jgi:hypothetical protein